MGMSGERGRAMKKCMGDEGLEREMGKGKQCWKQQLSMTW